jgi:rubredoxin
MPGHRYILQPYKGMTTRYTCPECGKPKKFARYIDTNTNDQLGDSVGKCERSDSCGYHYTPKQYFAANGIVPDHNTDVANHKTEQTEAPPTYFNKVILEKSQAGYSKNNFISFLKTKFSDDQVQQTIEKYLIGTSKHWPGATIFWQVDDVGNVRAGKVMLYNSETGKRVKEPKDRITWVHKVLNVKDFKMDQCFFGQHLLVDKSKTVAIVESEKTAIIASIYLPQFIWLSSSNKQGLSVNKCNSLKGFNVVLYPDLNAFEDWKSKADLYKFKISDLLERKATDDERNAGLDLADYLIRFDVSEFQKQDHPKAQEPDQPDTPIINPTVIPVHKKYTEAEAAGKLVNHPQTELINSLWESVVLYRNRPELQNKYINQLSDIEI